MVFFAKSCLIFSVTVFINNCNAEGINIALNKPVSLSSVYSDATPGSKAVDGLTSGYWNIDGCASTKRQSDPWMNVDLEDQYAISSIFILNRADNYGRVAYRLSRVHVQIGLSLFKMAEVAYHEDEVGHNITFIFAPPRPGRFIKIWLEKVEYLTICEIEVYGNKWYSRSSVDATTRFTISQSSYVQATAPTQFLGEAEDQISTKIFIPVAVIGSIALLGLFTVVVYGLVRVVSSAVDNRVQPI